MERPPLPPPPKQQLNCPRCDSSNTKFCYYNNYSLSQPRHFCKACKRYWTRGGTLRNVPVGGGCRKNKRVKKPSPPTSSAAAAAAAADPPLPTHTQIDVRSADPNTLFYGGLSYNYTIPPPPQPQQQQQQFDGLGLGFQPTEFSSHLPQFVQLPAVMGSSHEYPITKQTRKANDYVHFDSVNGNLGFLKDVKMEGWKLPCDQNPPDAIASAATATVDTAAASDSSFQYWNPTMSMINSWPDLNYGSSMAPLI